MEAMTPEVAPFGIRTMLVEPGFFRTELLTPESTSYATSTIDDYAARTEQTIANWKTMNGRQGGDPAKLAAALVQLAALEEPPLRFPAGADAVEIFEQTADNLPRRCRQRIERSPRASRSKRRPEHRTEAELHRRRRQRSEQRHRRRNRPHTPRNRSPLFRTNRRLTPAWKALALGTFPQRHDPGEFADRTAKVRHLIYFCLKRSPVVDQGREGSLGSVR